jgi:hypothetical protein
LKKERKIFVWTILTIAGIIIVMFIGIPTRIVNKSINDKTFDSIKGVQNILSTTKEKISLDSIEAFSPLAHDAYGYISSPQKVDELFSFLPIDQRQRIKRLFTNRQVTQIDIMRPRCVRFILKQSFQNYFITSSYETLILVFNDSCKCNCQDMRMDEETISKQDLGNGWYKVSIVTRRTAPHA